MNESTKEKLRAKLLADFPGPSELWIVAKVRELQLPIEQEEAAIEALCQMDVEDLLKLSPEDAKVIVRVHKRSESEG